MTHGFTWTQSGGFQTVDDPHGIGATTINGVNDNGDLVGFYTDAPRQHGRTAGHGAAASPRLIGKRPGASRPGRRGGGPVSFCCGARSIAGLMDRLLASIETLDGNVGLAPVFARADCAGSRTACRATAGG